MAVIRAVIFVIKILGSRSSIGTVVEDALHLSVHHLYLYHTVVKVRLCSSGFCSLELKVMCSAMLHRGFYQQLAGLSHTIVSADLYCSEEVFG
jgi:hypothetical protein